MSNEASAPCSGTYWVIPGRLLAGVHPGGSSPEEMEAMLAKLLDAGITSVVNLVEDESMAGGEDEVEEVGEDEHFLAYEDRLEALAEERGRMVEIMRHPIASTGAPTDQEMQLILDAIDAELDGRDSPTYVHCSDGAGRTGLVVGCYLARHGIAAGADAVAKIHELRTSHADLAETRSPANIVHERMVSRWKPDH